MNKQVLAIAGIGMAAVAWTLVSAQQEMLPRPGPGSGITPVRLVEDSTVTLSKNSEVRVSGPLTVSFRAPSFATTGRTLLVTWADGEQERITIADVVDGSWIEVQGSPTRYVNLANARSVQVAR